MGQVFSVQNETVLLENATIITKYDDFITKCDSYYKRPRLLQIAAVQSVSFQFHFPDHRSNITNFR